MQPLHLILFVFSYSFVTWIFLLLTKMYMLKCLLAIFSGIPVVAAASSEMPFPNISFKAFNKFVISSFGPQVSLATVLLVLFTMTENSDLLNLHAHQRNPQYNGEMKQSSSGWIKALAQCLDDRLQDKIKDLFMDTEVFENSNDLITSLTGKLDKLMDLLQLNPFAKSGKLEKKLKPVSHDEITCEVLNKTLQDSNIS